MFDILVSARTVDFLKWLGGGVAKAWMLFCTTSVVAGHGRGEKGTLYAGEKGFLLMEKTWQGQLPLFVPSVNSFFFFYLLLLILLPILFVFLSQPVVFAFCASSFRLHPPQREGEGEGKTGQGKSGSVVFVVSESTELGSTIPKLWQLIKI